MDTRSPAKKEDGAHRDAAIMRMRREGKTFPEIGDELGFSKQYAQRRYKELLAEIPALEVAEYRAEQLERYDWLTREAVEILRRDHVHVSQGRVVRETPDGPPLLDDGPKLAAIRELRQIEAQRSELLGTKTPVKTEGQVGVELKVSVVGVDVGKMT